MVKQSFDMDDFIDGENLFEGLEEDYTTLEDEFLQGIADQLDPDRDTEVDAGDSISWKPQAGPQEDAFYCEADELFFGGAAGGGKQISDTINVVTPFGNKLHGDLEVGDVLCNPDGSTAKVIAVFENGVRDVYEVTFVDGSSVVAGDEHLWLYSLAGKRVKRTAKRYGTDVGWQAYPDHKNFVGTTLQLKEHVEKAQRRLEEGKRPHHPLIPLVEPVAYTMPMSDHVKSKWIDPYFLGLLLGDGSIASNQITITTTDDFIRDWVMDHWGYERTYWDGEKILGINASAELRSSLEYWDLLGTYSHTKFIPERYLLGRIEQRFDLMQGLMDTDGYVDDRGRMSYTTVSEQLAKDVQSLAWSLGAKANITSKQGGYKKDSGEYVECKEAHTVWFQGRHLEQFVRLPRKKELYKPFNGGNSIPKRRVVSVEKVGEDSCKCIAVDHPNQLYIVDDYIVTHNTDLMVGLGVSPESPHRDSVVYRSTYREHQSFVKRVKEVIEAPKHGRFIGGSRQEFVEIPGDKSMELGSVGSMKEAEKYRGRPHDLIMFDELPRISEEVYTFLINWNRTTLDNVPTRIVSAGNPPANSDEAWVIRRWAAWLDPNHPNPASPGEIRWFANLDGKDTEITPEISEAGAEGKPFDYETISGRVETIYPKSRTFIPARVTDNKYLGRDYIATLQSTPEPLRSQLLYGDFSMSSKPDPWQVIPTQWVLKAQDRWRELEKEGWFEKERNSNIYYGLDVAEDGKDLSALAKISKNVVHWIEYTNESDTMAMGDMFMNKIVYDKTSPIAVDGIGAGKPVADRLARLNYNVLIVKVSRKSRSRDSSGKYEFHRLRDELWWKFREALDPESDDPVILPPSRRLAEELTAPRYDLTSTGDIKVQSKNEIRAKLGRSPDGADAVLLAHYVQRQQSRPLRMV